MKHFFSILVFLLAVCGTAGAAVHNVRDYGATGDGTNIDSPIFIRLGRRMRSPEGRDDPHYGVIIAGIAGHDIEDITLRNIHLNYVGGLSPEQAQKTMPANEENYPDPWMFAETDESYYPFKGMFLRNVNGITLDGIHFSYEKPDSRQLILKDNARNVIARDITLERKPVKFK